MKLSKTNRVLYWILIYAFTLMQASPAWANAAVGSSSSGSSGGGSSQGTTTGGSNGAAGDPVDTKTGNNYFTETDLVFNTPGVPLEFSRKYNSKETFKSPFGAGWSHSMDWRLHQAREVVTKIIPPVTNQSFKVNLWEGTQLLCEGQVVWSDAPTHGVFLGEIPSGTIYCQTNLLTVVPEFLYGSPVKDQVDAHVSQPGKNYSVDLDQPYTYGPLGEANPVPVVSLEDMDGNLLPTDGVSYSTNQWLEVYLGDGSSVRCWDNDTNGTYVATDRNWSITPTNDLWVLHLPEGESRIFNGEGRMVRHQNGWGQGISFIYDALGKLETAVHDNGLALQFTYEAGLIVSVSAGSGASLLYDYTALGLLDTVTQNYGSKQRTRQYQYSYASYVVLLDQDPSSVPGEYHPIEEESFANVLMTKRINPEGHEYIYGYAPDAKATSGTVNPGNWMSQSLIYRSETLTDYIAYARGLEQWHRYAYSSKSGKLDNHFGPGTSTVDAETRGTRYTYNSAKDEIENTQFDNNTGAFFSSFTDYDGRHNPTASAVAYNTTNRTPVSSIVWNSTYMLPSSVQNAEGEKTTMIYTNGSLAKLSEFYTPSNSWNTLYGYTTNGLLAAVTNAKGNATQYTYDRRGYPETVIPAAGPSVATAYDTYGNLQTLEILPEGGTNGTGRVTQYSINPLGWLESITYADGRTVSNQYNKLGDLTNTVDRAGRVTEWTYTPESYLASKTQYLEQNGSNVPVRIAYDYDQQFNSLSITEPRGRYVESYQLDIQDRIVAVTNIEGQVMTFGYSVGSMVTNVTRFDQSRLDTSYDSAGRQSAIAYYSSSNELLSTISRTYYADSQLKTISDGTSSISNSYDRLNRLTNVVTTIGNQQSSIGNAYDPVGNITTSVVSFANSAPLRGISYSYDAAERLTGIYTTEGTETQSFAYAYSPMNGRVSSITNLETGIVTSYAYDIMDRATNIAYRTSTGTLIRSLDYQYDASSMITNKTEFQVSGFKSQVSYTYDSINRLIREDSGDSWAEYAYDLAGNRTKVVFDGVTNTYTLSAGDRLQSVASAQSAEVSFAYDAAGNTTNIITGTNSQALSWNEKYQLISARSATSAVEYSYDVLGRRVSRVESAISNSSSAITNLFVYDGNQVAADLDGSGNVLRTYAWGPGIDNLLSLTVWSGGSGSTPTATYYPLKDHQNSVVALVDALGNVVESYRYDAYGRTTIFDSTGTEIANHQSAVGNRYLWQGREYDSATGLYYFRARWYIPGIEDSSGRSLGVGRWLSKDPIGISGGLNLYVFCGNNPINFTDPFGECEKGYWDRYMEHLDKYAIKLDPAVVAGLIGGGVMPKSWAPATGGRGPLLGSDNPLTSVLRGLGVPGAGAAVVRGGAAAVGVAGVGIGTYNTGVLVSGLVYAAFPGSNGL